jgi:hypothetical protein
MLKTSSYLDGSTLKGADVGARLRCLALSPVHRAFQVPERPLGLALQPDGFSFSRERSGDRESHQVDLGRCVISCAGSGWKSGSRAEGEAEDVGHLPEGILRVADILFLRGLQDRPRYLPQGFDRGRRVQVIIQGVHEPLAQG